MTDRPIIFSGPMVRALLDGRKTQTRRLATSPLRKCEAGDRLYVRETFHPWKGSASGKTIVYVADDEWIDHGSGDRFIDKVEWLTPATPSIHMPRWASRLTLEVVGVRIEPLQSISEADAVAEGVGPDPDGPITAYARLWAQLHGRESWLSSPDVLVLTFTVARGNIDRLAA